MWRASHALEGIVRISATLAGQNNVHGLPMAEYARINPPLIAARTFEAAARLGSFRLAAVELNVTPAAVSHQIKRLEDYLGIALFKRTNRKVELTDAGEALAAKLSEYFTGLERLLDPKAYSTTGIVRITAMPSLAAKWLAPRLPDFLSLHPDLNVELDDGDELTSFGDGRFDLALRYGAGPYPGTHCIEWMAAPVVAVCSPALLRGGGPPLARPADIAHHTLLHDSTPLLPGKPPGWPQWISAAGVTGVNGAKGLRFSSVYVTLEAARAGRGVALAPEPLVRDDLRAGILAAPLDLALDNACRFWIVYPEGATLRPGAQALIDWLLKQGAGAATAVASG